RNATQDPLPPASWQVHVVALDRPRSRSLSSGKAWGARYTPLTIHPHQSRRSSDGPLISLPSPLRLRWCTALNRCTSAVLRVSPRGEETDRSWCRFLGEASARMACRHKKRAGERSGGRHRPAVDDVFGPRDGGRARRRQKRDQIGDLSRLGRPAERNAAKRIHDDLSTTLVVGGVLPRDLRDETHSRIGLDPAGRDAHDAHSLRTHFLGQRLAVVRQGRFRRSIGYRRLGQRQPILYRGDVDDDAGALLDHQGHERAIETYGGEEILIERPVPLLVVEYSKPSGRGGGAADDMHDDVYAAETITDSVGDGVASFGRGHISGNKCLGTPNAFGTRPGSGQNRRAGIA